jgi:16S rRNA (cytosine967-C5)-methyltransferase
MKNSDRFDALNILLALFENKVSLTYSFKYQKKNSDPISPLTKEICFGVCRYYYSLELIANNLMSKKPQDIDVWIAILIGLYQLEFLNTPEYAAVQETVNLAIQIKKPWAKGLINAILRTYCREKNNLTIDEILNKKSNHKINKEKDKFIYNHPLWLINIIKNDWPNDWNDILTANNSHPPMSLRVNNLKTSTKDYLKTLEENQITGTINQHIESAIILDNPCKVSELPKFLDGFVSVQDVAAQVAIKLLDLKPNLRILDACCAPGGKTCHILETEPNIKSCVAIDIDKNRLTKVHENLSRLNLNALVQKADASKPNEWWDNELFDRILLDAPCSATGVIRRNPDIKLLRTKEEIDEISKLQFNLLETLWPLLKEGGKMLYITCSILHIENDKQIEKFIKKTKDCEYMQAYLPFGVNGPFGIQILPGKNNMDGFFYSVLFKTKPQ